MRALIACERSGVVRDAFIARGHDATSCDLEPTDQPGPHYRGDVRDLIGERWDLMIAHPPCTFLSRAGARWRTAPGRTKSRDDAMKFFIQLWTAAIPRVCVENPEGFPRSVLGRPHQVINPYEFGEPTRKKTLLWLRGLPPLFATLLCPPPPVRIDSNGKRRHFTDSLPSGSPLRSQTFAGIASAMADQWGGIQPIDVSAGREA